MTIDEAHKIFDRLSDFLPAFDDMKQLKDLEHPIVAMSATLTDEQIEALKQQHLRNTHDCVVLTAGVHRNNLEICLYHYKRRQLQKITQLSQTQLSKNLPIKGIHSCHKLRFL